MIFSNYSQKRFLIKYILNNLRLGKKIQSKKNISKDKFKKNPENSYLELSTINHPPI